MLKELGMTPSHLNLKTNKNLYTNLQSMPYLIVRLNKARGSTQYSESAEQWTFGQCNKARKGNKERATRKRSGVCCYLAFALQKVQKYIQKFSSLINKSVKYVIYKIKSIPQMPMNTLSYICKVIFKLSLIHLQKLPRPSFQVTLACVQADKNRNKTKQKLKTCQYFQCGSIFMKPRIIILKTPPVSGIYMYLM